MSVVRPLRRRSSRLAASLAVVAALTLAGCGDSDAPKSEPSSSPQGGEPTGSTTAPADSPDPAVVTIIDAGTTPRRVVALDVEEGHTESSVIDITTTTEVDFMSTGAITFPMRLPFTTKVADVADDQVTVDVTYGKATVSAKGLQKDMLEQADKALGYLEGATARVVYGRSGSVISSEVELGDEAPDLVGRILDDVGAQSFALAVPFPTEKIGIGARWRVTQDLTLGAAQGTVTSTYTLTAVTADSYTVTVVARQKATPGDSLAGKVVGGSSTSTGRVSGGTGFVGPRLARTVSKGDATVDVGGQLVKTTFTIDLDATTR